MTLDDDVAQVRAENARLHAENAALRSALATAREPIPPQPYALVMDAHGDRGAPLRMRPICWCKPSNHRQEAANGRPNAATGLPPLERLPAEVATGGVLPPTAHDDDLFLPGQVSAAPLVAVLGNRYSVPVAHGQAHPV